MIMATIILCLWPFPGVMLGWCVSALFPFERKPRQFALFSPYTHECTCCRGLVVTHQLNCAVFITRFYRKRWTGCFKEHVCAARQILFKWVACLSWFSSALWILLGVNSLALIRRRSNVFAWRGKSLSCVLLLPLVGVNQERCCRKGNLQSGVQSHWRVCSWSSFFRGLEPPS